MNLNWDINRIENALYTKVKSLSIKTSSNADMPVYFGYKPSGVLDNECIVCSVPTNVNEETQTYGTCISRIAIWVKDGSTSTGKNRTRITKIHDIIFGVLPLITTAYGFDFMNEIQTQDVDNGYSITYINLYTRILS